MKKVIREYLIELVALVIILLGIFFLVERMDIRETLYQTGFDLIDYLRTALGGASSWGQSYLAGFGLSDLLGLALIILAVLFILWRIRYRFIRSERWAGSYCPKCGGRIHRKHRSSVDRFIGKVLFQDSARYKCSNEECDWTGLRQKGRRRKYRKQTDTI